MVVITEAKAIILSILAGATAGLSLCQTIPVKEHYYKHRSRHAHTQSVSRQAPKPTPAPSPAAKPAPDPLAAYPYGHESYLVHPDGRWEWIPPGPTHPKPSPSPSTREVF